MACRSNVLLPICGRGVSFDRRDVKQTRRSIQDWKGSLACRAVAVQSLRPIKRIPTRGNAFHWLVKAKL
jgi:hypothetical protein